MVRAVSVVAGAASFDVQQLRPWEKRLRRFSFGLLKDVRRSTIRIVKLVRRSVRLWGRWALTGAGFLLVGALASSADMRLVGVWKSHGAGAALQYVIVGAIVFVRLLFDGGLARWPRLVFLAALLYGVLPRDLVPDGTAVVGWLDDLVLAGGVGRWFVGHCPDGAVVRHAATLTQRLPATTSPPSP